MKSSSLNTNAIAFIALCNEYCHAVENARESERDDFIDSMLRLLPRLYMSASGLDAGADDDEDAYIESSLDEDYYDSVRRSIENIMGPDDVYLEVFEEDMKYSDTPISASVSECLSDIFQPLYNLVETVKDAPSHIVGPALVAARDDFRGYWGQILCNVLRPLHHIRYSTTGADDI